ncbi:tripartite motif-containing protein 12A-like isoform X6 [Hydra vulgaris]|uniref:Tripartite motif-containing protein 12A-like isoform X6 n=1 Tax=Hydra vulgaris TaxID=6087 RepID=A0ABM4CEC3_HYDVU
MASLNEENFGGYDAYFINELLDEHECPVCKMALRKPIQTKCGHRLCLSCAEEMRKRNKGVLICPLDNSILDSSEIFSDAAIERVIMQLKVKCSNFSNGCEWTGELKILNIHEENCECLPLCCVNQCGMKLMRKEGMRKEHETHTNSLMQNHLSMAISKLDALENKITLTVDTLENKIASKVNALENKIMLRVDALENKIMSKVESLETKTVSKAVALENKITSKVESFENKNASEVVALENKITSTVDALKNELISKVDAQKDEILLHEKNLEIIKAFLAVKTAEFVTYEESVRSLKWLTTPFSNCDQPGCLTNTLHEFLDDVTENFCTYSRNDFLKGFTIRFWYRPKGISCLVHYLHHTHHNALFEIHARIQKKLKD